MPTHGIEVIAVDRYPDAPRHTCGSPFTHVINMLDGEALRRNDYPEGKTALYRARKLEAIATDTLRELEAKAECRALRPCSIWLTMVRRDPSLAAEKLGLPTSTYPFAKQWGPVFMMR